MKKIVWSSYRSIGRRVYHAENYTFMCGVFYDNTGAYFSRTENKTLLYVAHFESKEHLNAFLKDNNIPELP